MLISESRLFFIIDSKNRTNHGNRVVVTIQTTIATVYDYFFFQPLVYQRMNYILSIL